MVIINVIRHYGIKGERLNDTIGVWIDDKDIPRECKVCAIDVRSVFRVCNHVRLCAECKYRFKLF
ncbi:MAG: hypothetical protein LBL90_12745 [Prevotellaceae bacterium]|nr:hypothetical protein [Prevotellaceae bacterium]